MILIYEVQEDLRLNKKYSIGHPIKEAGRLYKYLYRLDGESLMQITEIYFVSSFEIDSSLFLTEFKRYSAYWKDYNEQYIFPEISDEVPSPKEILDEPKRKYIEQLIKKASIKICNTESKTLDFIKRLKDEQCIILLKFKKALCGRIINELDSSRLHLIGQSGQMKLRAVDELRNIDADIYKGIALMLKQVREKYNKYQPEFSESWNYQHCTMLENFAENFFNELQEILRKDSRKIHFHSGERYISQRAIRQIVPTDYQYYFLDRGIPHIEKDQEAKVFYNFDHLKDSVQYKKLYDCIKKLDHIILQEEEYKHIEYFSDYREVPLPDDHAIKALLTSIFLSILIENARYRRNECGKLLGLINSNALFELLKDYPSLERLSEAISNLSELDIHDLLNNELMWYYLVTEARAKADNEKAKMLEERKIYGFEHAGNNWLIDGLGNTIKLRYSVSLGIKILVVLMYYSKKFKKPIDSYCLRNITLRYTGQEDLLRERESMLKNGQVKMHKLKEKDRKAIGNAIYEIKKIPALKEFIDANTNFGTDDNIFHDKKSIHVEIKDPLLKSEFFI